jgi:hypothetical protein
MQRNIQSSWAIRQLPGIFAATALFFMFAAPGCGGKDKNHNHSASLSALFAKAGEEKLVWEKSMSFDPYNGGYYYPADSANRSFLIFASDGTFQEYDPFNYSKGNWYFNDDSTSLAFEYVVRNGTKVSLPSEESRRFSHRLLKIRPDSMVLAWQGRHGWVEETWLAVQPDLVPPPPDSLK